MTRRAGKGARGSGDGEAAPAAAATKPTVPAAAAPAAAPATLTAPLGQGAALERYLRAARRLQMHHALLVTGAPGSGKSTVLRWLAAALLCPSELDRDGPCGVCRTCRRVATGQHPDLHVVEVEPERREIRIEQVRDLQQVLLRHAVEGRARVVLVDPASHLNEEGQNALLKTLEEPGVDTFLLLATSRPEALLPTVRSRCERVGVRRLADDVVARELKRRLPTAAAHHERAVAFARGRLGAALRACTEQAVQLQDLVRVVCADAQGLRALVTARAIVGSAQSRIDAVAAARTFLELLRHECAQRMRALADDASGSYVPPSSTPWASLLELALFAEQDLDLLIPAEQVLVGLFVQWHRLAAG